jgi:hypothetical protein
MESSSSESKRSSSIDASADDAEEMRAGNPVLENNTHNTADANVDTDDMEFNERIEAAEHKLSRLLIEAQRPLTETNVTPAQDAVEEQIDREAAVLWAEQYERAEQALENAEQNNGVLLKDVNMATDAICGRISANPANDSTTSEAAPVQILEPKPTHVEEDLLPCGSSNEHSKSDRLVMPMSKSPSTPPPQPFPSTKPAVPVTLARTTTNIANKEASTKSACKQAKQRKNHGWHALWSFNFDAKW